MKANHAQTPVAPAPRNETFSTATEVLRRLPMSRSSWNAGVASGKFPAAIRFLPHRLVWRDSDIDALIASPPK